LDRVLRSLRPVDVTVGRLGVRDVFRTTERPESPLLRVGVRVTPSLRDVLGALPRSSTMRRGGTDVRVWRVGALVRPGSGPTPLRLPTGSVLRTASPRPRSTLSVFTRLMRVRASLSPETREATSGDLRVARV
jgi:hypothetical protein